MWQYPVKFTYIQVDITFVVLKLIDGVPSHAKGAWRLKWPGIVALIPNGEEVPMQVRAGRPGSEEGVGGAGLGEWRCDLANGLFNEDETFYHTN